MPLQPEITQADLRNRSEAILDAVEHGRSFIVTRDGHRTAELTPLPRRRFVTRADFAAKSRDAPAVDLDLFRADQDAAANREASTSTSQA
ncbi:prevent-host-death protein [Nocardia panacis]|uniref:Prevent-host-death protein n=2 Tax=Nocardia panacis TaxID=2340916 RepID=A0A3A4KTP8_9NOCA|nr:prevent-host-death protein [Nocardia panacis]